MKPFKKMINPDQPKVIPLSFILKNRLLLISLSSAVIIIATILSFVIYQQKQPAQPTPTPLPSPTPTPLLEQVILGKVKEIKKDLILVQENDLTSQILVNGRTQIFLQKVSLPTKKESQASGTAKLISRLLSNEPSSFDQLKVGDEVKITLLENGENLIAKTIMIFRKQSGK